MKFYQSEYETLKVILQRIEQTLSNEGRQKLHDEDEYLHQALRSIEGQIQLLFNVCEKKSDAWREFQIRFDQAKNAFNQAMILYENSSDQLDSIKVRC